MTCKSCGADEAHDDNCPVGKREGITANMVGYRAQTGQVPIQRYAMCITKVFGSDVVGFYPKEDGDWVSHADHLAALAAARADNEAMRKLLASLQQELLAVMSSNNDPGAVWRMASDAIVSITRQANDGGKGETL